VSSQEQVFQNIDINMFAQWYINGIVSQGLWVRTS